MLCHLRRTGALTTCGYPLARRRPPGATPFATDIRSGSWPRDRVRWFGVPRPPDRAAPGGRRRRGAGGGASPRARAIPPGGRQGRAGLCDLRRCMGRAVGWPGAGGIRRGDQHRRALCRAWHKRPSRRSMGTAPCMSPARRHWQGSNGSCTFRASVPMPLRPRPMSGPEPSANDWCGNSFPKPRSSARASCSGRTTRSSTGWRPWRG